MLDLGQVVMTQGINQHLEEGDFTFNQVKNILVRHAVGDWGSLDKEDAEANNQAVIRGERILSSYKINKAKVWIITEWDRSITTILLPDEY